MCVKKRQLRGEILKAKFDFKTKIEGNFFTGNVRQAWEGLNTLMGRSNKKDNSSVRNCQTFINDLNIFYCRFDTVEGKTECDEICNNLSVEESLVIKEMDVMASLRNLKSNKTTGPDGLRAVFLKTVLLN